MLTGNSFIRQRRTELGLSQTELAIRADVSTRTIQFAENGNKVMTRKSLELIALALGVEYQEIAKNNVDADRDAIVEWPWSLSKFIQGKILPEDGAFCRDSEEAMEGIKAMRESWATHLAVASLHPDGAVFEQADQILDNRYKTYQERYLTIWRKNKASLHFATLNGERTGISVVLPISTIAYQKLRAGNITFMDISDADVEAKSQNLVLDSAVEFPSSKPKPWFKLTDSLSFAVFYQIATLSLNPSAADFRMLSFGASPTNIGRLESIGFRSRDVVMPEFGYQVCEFTNNSSDLDFDTFAATSTLSHFAHLFKAFVHSDLRLKAKRNLITRALRIYQQLVLRMQRGTDHSINSAA